MPEKRGRKRRQRDRRERADVPEAAAPIAPASVPAVPSNTARATGLAIGVITVFLAILTIGDGLTGGSSTGEAALRVVIGAVLVLVGVVVSLLAVFPAQIRRKIRGV
jgi:hypothetical protein